MRLTIFFTHILECLSISAFLKMTGNTKPVGTTRLTISSIDGIQFDENFEQGNQIVEIVIEDQTTYTHLQGHNVKLVK